MLGQIESFRRDIGAGIIRCEDGRKVRFQRNHLVNARETIVGEEVDFVLDGRTPRDIIVLAGSPWSVFAGNVLWVAPSDSPSSSRPEGAEAFDWRMAA